MKWHSAGHPFRPHRSLWPGHSKPREKSQDRTGDRLSSRIGSLALAIGYSVIVGWILKYAAGSLTGSVLAQADIEGFGQAFGQMAAPFGNNFWQTVGIVITFIIMVCGISGGIEKINKVIMPLFFFLFLGLAVYMAFQPGAAEGYRYIFRIEPEGLADPMTWVFALGQAFFSLSLAGNGTLIYGSYLKDSESYSAARKVASLTPWPALLAALVIIPAMATTGSQLNEGGPGLIFIYLPNLFKSMPGSRILVIVFFTAVFFAGISSIINLFEAPIATLEQHFKLSRRVSVTIGCVAGSRSRPLHPGNRIRLDGLRFYLYLSIGRRPGRNHVFLGIWQRFCKKRSGKGPPKTPWFLVPLYDRLCLLRTYHRSIYTGNYLRRHWLIQKRGI